MSLYTLNIVLDLTAHALWPDPHIKQIFQKCLELSIMSIRVIRYFSVNWGQFFEFLTYLSYHYTIFDFFFLLYKLWGEVLGA